MGVGSDIGFFETKLHIPIPTVGTLPVMVTLGGHTVLSTPAFETVGVWKFSILTSSPTEQFPLVIVHFNKYKPYLSVEPIFNVPFGELALVKVAFDEPVGCERIVQIPVCPDGTGSGVTLPVFKVMAVPSQNCLSKPALGTLAAAETLTVTLEATGVGQVVALGFLMRI